MKVLLSAYACEPGKGSEPEVGFRTLLTAAKRHEVWVLTRENNLPPLREFLAGHELEDRIHLHGFDVPGTALRMKKRGIFPLHWYYDVWQRRVAQETRRLDARMGFDLVHHVTFAAYWTRAGVRELDRPFVWGPVGGGLSPPLGLLSELGWRGMLNSMGRSSLRRIFKGILWNRWSRPTVDVALAQNRETARRLSASDVRVVPNTIVVDPEDLSLGGARTPEVVFVARLIPLKAGRLAVRTFRHVTHPDARLVIYGRGPDRKRIEAAVQRWGLAERVELSGHVSREELLERVGRAGALLHSSLLEEGGMAVAEALSLGTPVVCLAHGGPVESAKRWPASPVDLIDPSTPEETAKRMARAVDRFLFDPPPVPDRVLLPRPSYEEELESAYRRAVAGSS